MSQGQIAAFVEEIKQISVAQEADMSLAQFCQFAGGQAWAAPAWFWHHEWYQKPILPLPRGVK
jgi:hypothetical protein